MRKELLKNQIKIQTFSMYLLSHSPPHAYSPFPSIAACMTFDLVYQIISELLEGWDPVLLTWTTDFHIVDTQHISLMLSLKGTVDKGSKA